MEEVVGTIRTRSGNSFQLPMKVLLTSSKDVWGKKMRTPPLPWLRKMAPSFAGLLCLWMAGALAASATDTDKAWSLLRAAASNKNKDHRTHAIKALGLISRNNRAMKMATKALDDESPEVRAAAADALGHMHAKVAAPRLKKLLENEKDVAVIMAGARALIAIGDPFGYNVYYAVLTGEKKSGGGLLDDQKKMLHDPKKMAEFGFEQGIGFVPFAGIGIEAVKALRKDDSSPVRAAAARVLADDPDPSTTDALLTAASDKNWIVRAAALDSISRRNDPALADQIQNHLEDGKEEVRLTAAAAMIHLMDLRAGKRKPRP
jgi:HEAT repeat protein